MQQQTDASDPVIDLGLIVSRLWRQTLHGWIGRVARLGHLRPQRVAWRHGPPD